MEILRLHLAEVGAKRFEFDVPVHGFVIMHPTAGAILVDTGVGFPFEIFTDWRIVNHHMKDALAEHDLAPIDVKIVINTHLHFDHCGQNAVFRHAPFYVQRTELDRARRDEKRTSEWFDFAGARFELMDGDAEVAPGVRVVATPGHTLGHQSVLVETQEGDQVFIGDAAYNARIFESHEDFDPNQVPGQAADSGSWRRSLERLHSMRPEQVHFCHDTSVLHRVGDTYHRH